MKFVCSNCKAKYQIADEKILGRTLKMDCRRCNASITIRGDLPQQADEMDLDEGDARPASVRPPAASAPAGRRVPGAAAGGSSVGAHPASASVASRPRTGLGAATSAPLGAGSSALGADFRRGASMAPEARPQESRTSVLDQWHVAINDVPVGPMRREEVSRKIATGAITPDSLAWREGFDDWRPVRDVPELAALLRKAEPVRAQPAPRPGASTSAGSRLAAASPSRLGARPAAGAAAPAAQARGGNVVPIGGRLGGAAPAFDEEHGLDEGQDEPTQIASAADLGLLAFGDANALRDPGAPKVDAKAKAPQKPEIKAPAPIPAPRKDPTGPIPAPRKDPTGPAKIAAPVAPPKAKEPSVKTPIVAPEDDGLPPLLDAPIAPNKDPFAAPPAMAPAAIAPAPVAPMPSPASVGAPVAAPVAREPERRRGIPVFAWMGIAGAVAFGGVFAMLAAQRFLPSTTTPAAVATVVPAPVVTPPAAPEVVPDVEATPAAEVAPETPPAVAETPTAPAETTEGGSRPRTGGSRPSGSTTGTTPATGAERPAPELTGALARMAEESGGPAAIGGAATRRDLTDGASAAGTGELTAEQIAHVVTRERTGLQRCWETAIRGMRETPTVRMDVDLTIGSSGTVTAAAARGPTVGSLSECIERGVRRWRFPASGGTSRTSFPVVFSGTN